MMADPVETQEYRLWKLENDYGTWAVLFRASLEDKELWEAISEPRPDEAAEPTGVAAWTKKDKRAFGRFKMRVALHRLPTVQACGSAKAAWDALEAFFKTKNNARRLQLTQDFSIVGGPAHALAWLLRGDSRATFFGDSAESRPTAWNGRSAIWRQKNFLAAGPVHDQDNDNDVHAAKSHAKCAVKDNLLTSVGTATLRSYSDDITVSKRA